MTSSIITVENLGKRYLISNAVGENKPRYRALRDMLTDRMNGIGRLFGGAPKAGGSRQEFWALRDVSFSIKQGEVVGIIGRNGAGKSTLLKVLSRITEPTRGKIRLKGRVASLLEVGTGFHPELSGRENIFLNGAILGMARDEIQRKFDEIVAFAEVERFLDTPVKRYSSGMYVRLAFAVAAHLEPEILVVDEVLAVGDAAFQKKCLGKMGDVSKSGRTVLFVSHNMGAVATLCSRGIVLKGGQVELDGTTEEAIRAYTHAISKNHHEFESDLEKPHITRVEIDQEELLRGNLRVRVHFKSPFPLDPPVAGVVLSSLTGSPVFGTNATVHAEGFRPRSMKEGISSVMIRDLPLHTSTYKLSIWLSDATDTYDSKLDVLTFDFISRRFSGKIPPLEIIGPVDVRAQWSLQEQAQADVPMVGVGQEAS